ncbi:glycosyltransferase [Candidatus Parcubacteria bacterium]|nr:glycosyltransferase [Candidatus Parcubacteria bacterium]
MKVLHILNSIEFSGAEIMLKNVAPIFVKNRFELHALSTGANRGSYANVLRASGYTVHHIHFKKSAKYFIELYRFLLRENFDVVHIHPERAFFWHSLIAKLAGLKRIVRTVHTNFDFTGYLRLKRTLQRFIANKIAGVQFITIGPSVYETEKRVFFNNSILIPNWVNEAKFLPAQSRNEVEQIREKLRIPPNDTVVISVGSCTDVKNHDDIITACADLCKKIKNIAYIHVGDGPLIKQEKDLAKAHGISEKVIFLGQIENVREALIASDIFVMPSDYEGIGISKLEAMYCGLPLVVYDNNGVRDFVEDGKNGFLVSPNPRAIGEAIEKLILNKTLRKEMGKQARETVLQNFNMGKSLGKLMKIYHGAREV